MNEHKRVRTLIGVICKLCASPLVPNGPPLLPRPAKRGPPFAQNPAVHWKRAGSHLAHDFYM